MKDQPRRKELCGLASFEQDPQKLMELVMEINHLLEEKQNRLKQSGEPVTPSPTDQFSRGGN
jgi:hypothetical protein